MTKTIKTDRLELRLDSVEAAKAKIEAMPEEYRQQLSPDWLALIESASESSPWIHGFQIFKPGAEFAIGSCGFKGPPSKGIVEIAYAIDPNHQRLGYATETVASLTPFRIRLA